MCSIAVGLPQKKFRLITVLEEAIHQLSRDHFPYLSRIDDGPLGLKTFFLIY